MISLVVDSSVAIKWFVVEIYSTEANRILADYQAGNLLLLAPDLINAEVGNIVWKKHIFQGLAANDAQFIVDTFRTVPLLQTSTAELLDTAYHLAIAHKRTVYDMLYVALSLMVGCQFVTADEKLVNAIYSAFPNVVWVGDWP